MFGLSFLSPLFLIGAAAAAMPIAIHLFYRRAEPVIEFAAMRYLRQAPVEQSRRRRLRELLLLALRVAALMLLAWAFARPYVSGFAAALRRRRDGRARRHVGEHERARPVRTGARHAPRPWFVTAPSTACRRRPVVRTHRRRDRAAVQGSGGSARRDRAAATRLRGDALQSRAAARGRKSSAAAQDASSS